MDPFDFKDFKSRIRGQLKIRNIDFSEVEYIALTKVYWMSFDTFIKLETIPVVWMYEEDIWEHIDTDFRLVLKDGRWLQYFHVWSDTYYSHFRLMDPPAKPRAQLKSL